MSAPLRSSQKATKETKNEDPLVPFVSFCSNSQWSTIQLGIGAVELVSSPRNASMNKLSAGYSVATCPRWAKPANVTTPQ